MNDADYIEREATRLDDQERVCREVGMFDLAVCYQQLASWVRCRTPSFPLRGMGALSVAVHFSNNLAVGYGTLPTENWHDAARYLVHTAIRQGYPPAPRVNADLLADEIAHLMDQVRGLGESVAELRAPPEPDASPAR